MLSSTEGAVKEGSNFLTPKGESSLSRVDIEIENFTGIRPDVIEGLILKSATKFPSNIEKQVKTPIYNRV